jgi:ribosomal protein S18 acetylase RimI-like enzyme
VSGNKPADLTFRSAQPDDLADLLHIESACFTGDRLSRRSFRRWISAPHAILLLALSEQRLMGYGLIWCYSGSDIARLYSLAVLPAARSLGLSDQLLAELEQRCLARNYRRLRLEVAKSNQPAIRLYERCGFQVFGEYSDYYADHGDALRMQKRLIDIPGSIEPEQPGTVYFSGWVNNGNIELDKLVSKPPE